MNQVILIHGMPDKEEYFDSSLPKPIDAHWLPWIKESLKEKGIETNIPEMPRPYEPNYRAWSEVFEQFKISNETTLVGHSCGGGFLLRYLSEHPELKPKRVILVAPWIDTEPYELEEGNDFFHFEIDPALTSRTELHVFISSDDDAPMIRTAEMIEHALPNTTWHRYTDKGHFTKGDLGTKEFPELLEEVLK
jgi:predicted alpha/beta hydrolase family esterase